MIDRSVCAFTKSAFSGIGPESISLFAVVRVCLKTQAFSVLRHYETNFLNLVYRWSTVKILKNGTPEIITIIVLKWEQLDFTVRYCVQKMQTE